MRDQKWAVVASYDAVYKAEMAMQRLEAAEIPSRIDKKGAVGLFGPGFGGTTVRGVDLLVPSAALVKAKDLLDLDVEDDA